MPMSGFASGASRYAFVPGSIGYADALIAAAQAGGWLLTVEGASENTALVNWLAPLTSGGVWLGISDAASEGAWSYVGGPSRGAAAFVNWNAGEPNGAASENQAQLTLAAGSAQGKWIDSAAIASQNAGYVIEFASLGTYASGQTTSGLGNGDNSFGYFETGNGGVGRTELFGTSLTVSNTASGAGVNVGTNANGNGILRIHDGAALTLSGMPPATFGPTLVYGNANLNIGRTSGGAGTVEIEGTGASVALSGYQAALDVGVNTGIGRLVLSDGARMSLAGGAGLAEGRAIADEYFDATSIINIGRNGGAAEAYVTGDDTTLTMFAASGEASIRVGRGATGTPGTGYLSIADGADVTLTADYRPGQADWGSGASLRVGSGAGSVGRIGIAGDGTNVQLAGHYANVSIGRPDNGLYYDTVGSGAGSLAVTDGARLQIKAVVDPDKVAGEKLVASQAISGGIDFDGGTSRVEIADPGNSKLDVSTGMTLEFYIDGKPYDATGTLITLARKGAAWSVTLDTKGTASELDDQVVFAAGTGTGATIAVDAAQFFDGFPHAVAMAYDGSAKTFRVLRDGTQVGSQTGIAGGPIAANNDPVQIGGTGTGGYSGAIDEVRLWNKARSNEAISAYSFVDVATSAERGANLVGQWKFDETSGTAIADSSGNAFTGVIIGGATRNSIGRWDSDGGDGSGASLMAGRGKSGDGTIEIAGTGTRVELSGHSSSLSAGELGGAGRFVISDGAVLSQTASPSPLLPDFWSGAIAFVGYGRGYVDGAISSGSLTIRDPGSMLEMKGHQASLYVARDRRDLQVQGGDGTLVVEGGAFLRLAADGVPDRSDTTNADHWSGSQINVGRGVGAVGRASISDLGTLVALSGQDAYLNAGREGGSGSVAISDGATLILTSAVEPERTAYVSGATLDLGRDAGSIGVMSISGPGTSVRLDGNDPTIRLGVSGGSGDLTVRDGALLSVTGGKSGTRTNINVGEASPLPAGVTYAPGTGVMVVSGEGTRVEIDGAPDATLTALTIGWIGTGAVIVEGGASVELGQRSLVALAAQAGSTGTLTVRGDGSLLSSEGFLIAGVLSPAYDSVIPYEALTPDTDAASGGTAAIHIEAGGRIAAPRGYLAGGALLDGDGAFTGLLRNMGGVVDPGREIGNLLVEGDYWQTGSGTLRLDLSAAGSDMLRVAGVARFDAGTIDFDPVSATGLASHIVVARAAGGIILAPGVEIRDVPSGYTLRVEEGGTALVLSTGAADTRAPLVVADAARLDAAGTHATLTFDETLVAANLQHGAFTVVSGGQIVAVSGVLVAGNAVTLSLSSAIAAGASASIAYADPSANQSAGVLQDRAGNDVASFSGVTAARAAPTAIPPDTVAPRLVSTSPADGAAGVGLASNLSFTFDETIQRGTGSILLKDGAGALVESFTVATSVRLGVSGKTLTVDPTANLSSGAGYVLEIPAGAIRDGVGNVFAGLSGYDFVAADTVAPVATGAALTMSRGAIVVQFSEDLEAATVAPSKFVVRVAGQTVATTNVAVTGDKAILTLHGTVAAGAEVSVGYTDAAGNQLADTIQDRAGNDVGSFTIAAKPAPDFFFGNSHYSFVPGRIAYADALTAAAAQGGWLVTTESGEENTALTGWLSGLTQGAIWLGISDAASEGNWVNTSGPARGAATGYFNWAGGEPNNQGNEDHAQLQLAAGEAQGLWTDTSADSALNAGYVIERAGGTYQTGQNAGLLAAGDNTLGYFEVGNGALARTALVGTSLVVTNNGTGSSVNVGINAGGHGRLDLSDGASLSVSGQPPAALSSSVVFGNATINVGRTAGAVGALSLDDPGTFAALRGYSSIVDLGVNGAAGTFDLGGGARFTFAAGSGVSDGRAIYDEYFNPVAAWNIGRNGGTGTARVEGEGTALDLAGGNNAMIRVGFGSTGTPGYGSLRIADGADVHIGSNVASGAADFFSASDIQVGRGLGSVGTVEVVGDGTRLDIDGHIARISVARPDNSLHYEVFGSGTGTVSIADGAHVRLIAVPDPEKVTGEKGFNGGLLASGGIDFDGAASFVEVADPGASKLDTASAMAIELFFDGKAYETTGQSIVLARKGDAWSVTLDTRGTGESGDDQIVFSASTAATIAVAAAQFFDGLPHQAAMVFDGAAGQFRVLRDGLQLASKSIGAGATMAVNDAAIQIGGNGTDGFSGAIDEIRLWNKARTNDAVSAYFMNDVSTSADRASSLVGWWKFDETSGTAVVDSSGNGFGGIIRGSASRVTLGRWDDDGGDYSSAHIQVGRGKGGDGTLLIAGSDTVVELQGPEAFLHVARMGATGKAIVSSGAQLTIASTPSSSMAEYFSGSGLVVGSERGYADGAISRGELIVRDPGTLAELTGHRASLVVGRDRAELGLEGGFGRFELSSGGKMRLAADGAADRVSASNADHWSGAEVAIGRGIASVGEAVISGAGSRLELSGHEAALRIGQGGGRGSLDLSDGATLALTSMREAERGNFVSAANLSVGRDPGSEGRLTMTGPGTALSIDGSDPGLEIGRRGATGILEMRDGAKLSITGGIEGTTVNLNIGDASARGTGETYEYGAGTMIVAGPGTAVEIDGAAAVNLDVVNIGRYGTGSLTIEDGGRVSLGERSIVAIASSSGSIGELVVRGAGSLLSVGGFVAAGVMRSAETETPTFETVLPWTRAASDGISYIAIQDGGRIVTPEFFLSSNALLDGDGSFEGVLRNMGGIVDPGVVIGTFNVVGDYWQTGSGTLRLDLSAAGSDLLSVTGVAQLDAGAIDFDYASPLGLAARIVVARAAGGIALGPGVDIRDLPVGYNLAVEDGGTALVLSNGAHGASDTRAPQLLAANAVQINSAGTQVTLGFDETLAAGSVPAGSFAVTSGGQPIAVSAVAVSGGTATLTLGGMVAAGASATIAYTDPGGDQAAGVLQDLAGNDVAGFSASATRAGAAGSDMAGMAYHWKSHTLLSGVMMTMAGDGKAPGAGPSLLEIRDLSIDANGDARFDVWADGGSVGIENFAFDLRVGGTAPVTWNGASFGGWLSEAQEGAGQLTVAAFGDGPLTGPRKLGSVIADLAPGTTQVQVDILSGEVGFGVVNAFSTALGRMTTDSSGTFSFAGLSDDGYAMSASRSAADTGNSISSLDALAALRIAVGRNPNQDPDGAGPLQPKMVSPYQFIAADVNGDGRVSSLDALGILKMAVQRPDAPAREWIFLREDADFWNEMTGTPSISKDTVNWNKPPFAVGGGAAADFDMVGVLKGDVNGSWAPSGSGVQTLGQEYFTDLAQRMGVPIDFWG